LSEPALAVAEGERGRQRATELFDRRHASERIALLLAELVPTTD
jgi:hypothetical protein